MVDTDFPYLCIYLCYLLLTLEDLKVFWITSISIGTFKTRCVMKLLLIIAIIRMLCFLIDKDLPENLYTCVGALTLNWPQHKFTDFCILQSHKGKKVYDMDKKTANKHLVPFKMVFRSTHTILIISYLFCLAILQ